MANANPIKLGAEDKAPVDKSAKPTVQYFGEGAEKIKFEADPKAKLIRVYSNGVVLVDY